MRATRASDANDLYRAYCARCGADEPPRTRDEVRDELRRRGYRYGSDANPYLAAIFEDGWAYGSNAGPSLNRRSK